MSDQPPVVTPAKPARRGIAIRAAAWLAVGLLLSVASAMPVSWVRTLEVKRALSPTPGSAFTQAYAERAGVRAFFSQTDTPGPPPSLARDRSIDPWWLRAPKVERVWMTSEYAAGWPLPIASAGFITSVDAAGQLQGNPWGVPAQNELRVTTPPALTAAGFPWSEMETPMMFPTRVLWLDLAINTVLYAIVVAIALRLFTGPARWLRRARRALRGRCEWCAYPLAGLDRDAACPECGRTAGWVATRPASHETSAGRPA